MTLEFLEKNHALKAEQKHKDILYCTLCAERMISFKESIGLLYQNISRPSKRPSVLQTRYIMRNNLLEAFAKLPGKLKRKTQEAKLEL